MTGSAMAARQRSCWPEPAPRCWSSISTGSGRTHRHDDPGGGRHRRSFVADVPTNTKPAPGRRRAARSAGSTPRQQCRHRRARQRRRDGAELAQSHAGQCRQHVHGVATRHSGHEGNSGRRRHRQRFVDFRATAARAYRLLDIKRRGHRADPGDGGRPWAGQYPRQLRRARAGLYADGLFAADEPRRAAKRDARPRCSVSRERVGTSATLSAFFCRPRRATLPGRPWSSTAEPLSWDPPGHP